MTNPSKPSFRIATTHTTTATRWKTEKDRESSYEGEQLERALKEDYLSND